jgi:thiol-disulfide isomerase/thioredoxin
MHRLLMIVAALALAACQQQAPAANEGAVANDSATAEAGGIKGVHRDNRGKPPPDKVFTDADGKPVSIGDFAGKPVLVNLWASWCAPCVKELPTLDKLAASGRMQVLAVSQDTGPQASVVAFLKSHGITTLKPYHDEKMGLSGALGPDVVLPTSILFDANGKEVWRYVGDLDWTSAEAAKLLSEAAAPAPAG